MTLIVWVTFLTLSTMILLICEQLLPILWRLNQRWALKKGPIELKLCAEPEALFNQQFLYDFYENKELIILPENVMARYKEGVLLYELQGASLTLKPCYWPLVSSLSFKIGQSLSLQNYAICFQELMDLKVLLDGQWELLQEGYAEHWELSIAALSALQEPGVRHLS